MRLAKIQPCNDSTHFEKNPPSTRERYPCGLLPLAETASAAALEPSVATGAPINPAAPQPVVKSLPEEFTDTRLTVWLALNWTNCRRNRAFPSVFFIVRGAGGDASLHLAPVHVLFVPSAGVLTALSSDPLCRSGVSWCPVLRGEVCHGAAARWRREIQRVNRMN